MNLSAPKPWLDAEDRDLRPRALSGEIVDEMVYELETAAGIRYARASIIDREMRKDGGVLRARTKGDAA